ncbi:MAG: hypothetical protein ABI458_05720 [Chloroflexota bacterium]
MQRASSVRIALLAVVASVAIATSACGETERASLPRPDPGETVATYLDDGRPVFAVGHQNGDISVLDATSTHVSYGVRVLNVWCPGRRTFQDLRAGGGWDEWGALGSGPPPSGLGSFSWKLRLGDDAHATGIDVTGFAGRVSGRAKSDGRSMFQGCDPSNWLFHTFDGVKPLTPAAAVASSPGGWVLLRGRIDFAGLRLCSEDAACLKPAHVADLQSPGAYPYVEQIERTADYLARVRDGALVELTWVVRSIAD